MVSVRAAMRRLRLLVVVTLIALAIGNGAQAAAYTLAPMRANALVAGKRVDAYPMLWWQWVNRKRWGAQAFQDPTGAQCALNQSGPVWFLAGTDGTDAMTRHCRVPSGKHVFLPIITMLDTAFAGQPQVCADLQAAAAGNNAHVVTTEVSVDGKRVDTQGLRMAGNCFNAYEYADFLEDNERGRLSATDGYWLMLAPFADGTHTIKVHVRYDNPGAKLGDMEQQFEYQLDVGGPEPAPTPDEDHDADAGWLKA